MASDLSSEFSEAPPTSQLEVPTILQRSSDFGSTKPYCPVDPSPILEGYKDIIWSRLQGWRIPTDDRNISTWVLRHGHGWRLELI
jgi:hypothetical protein